MKKIIIGILLSTVLVGCNGNGATDVPSSVSVNDSVFEIEVVADTDSVMELYPLNEGLPLSVLITGVMHNDEASPDIIDKGWFGLFRDRNKYYITPTTVNIKPAYDAIMDEDEYDTSKWTGWDVTTVNIDTALILISGDRRLNSHQIEHVPVSNDMIRPGSEAMFEYNGLSYTLYSTGKEVPIEYNPNEMMIQNYRLFLKAEKKGKIIEQLLAATPCFDDASFTIMLIGDIDNDGFLDFVIDTRNHYNVYRPTVYLSSFSEESQLVKVVGIHESVGC